MKHKEIVSCKQNTIMLQNGQLLFPALVHLALKPDI